MKTVKGRRRTGTLYRRWKGKKYPPDDPAAKDKGSIYLKYKVGGKTIVTRLGTSNLAEARKKQAQIMRPLELASEEEALDLTRMKLERIQDERQKEYGSDHPPLKLDAVWEAYISSQNRPQSGKATMVGYKSKWEMFVQWIHQTYPSLEQMNEIGVEEAEAYAAHLTSRKLSPSSYNQHLGALSLVWSVLFDKAHAKINPFAWDKKTRKGIQRRSLKAEAYQRRKRALSIKEINDVLEVAEGDYRTLILILVCTGQRLVDGLKLEWKSIDFKKRVITLVPVKTSRRTGKAVFIPLFPLLEQELLNREQQGRFVLPELVTIYDRDRSEVCKRIQRLFHKADICTTREVDLESRQSVTDVGAHSLRHTFVTIARMNGIPDAMIFQITGHSSKEMLEHYTQFSPEMAASLAGNFLDQEGQQDSRALPEPTEDNVIAQSGTQRTGKLRQALSLAERITGKRNESLKDELLQLLHELD
jgi:integrase